MRVKKIGDRLKGVVASELEGTTGKKAWITVPVVRIAKGGKYARVDAMIRLDKEKGVKKKKVAVDKPVTVYVKKVRSASLMHECAHTGHASRRPCFSPPSAFFQSRSPGPSFAGIRALFPPCFRNLLCAKPLEPRPIECLGGWNSFPSSIHVCNMECLEHDESRTAVISRSTGRAACRLCLQTKVTMFVEFKERMYRKFISLRQFILNYAMWQVRPSVSTTCECPKRTVIKSYVLGIGLVLLFSPCSFYITLEESRVKR